MKDKGTTIPSGLKADLQPDTSRTPYDNYADFIKHALSGATAPEPPTAPDTPLAVRIAKLTQDLRDERNILRGMNRPYMVGSPRLKEQRAKTKDIHRQLIEAMGEELMIECSEQWDNENANANT